MTFGKKISLLPDAKGIMDEYDTIVETSKTAIVRSLAASTQTTAAAEYFQHAGKAYVFDIKLIQDYLAEVSTKSNYVVLINASENNFPTIVFAGAHSSDSKNFFIVPDSQGDVIEHPEKNGIIQLAHGLDGSSVLLSI